MPLRSGQQRIHMPQNKINLLQRDQSRDSRFAHLPRTSLFILAAYIVAVVGVFSFYFFLAWQRGGLEAKNQDLVGQVQALKDTEGLLVTLKDRVAQAKSLYTGIKPTPADLVDAQVKLLPEGAQVSSINAKDDGTVTLIVHAQNSQTASEFLTAVKRGQPTTVVLNSLLLTETGGYTIGIEVSQ